MENFTATRYAMQFAECDKTDKVYVDKYSTNDFLINLAEEAGELISAISKYNRANGYGPITPVTPEAALENLKEELSDTIACGLLLAEKCGWLDDMIAWHKKKSIMCAKRIEEKNGEAE